VTFQTKQLKNGTILIYGFRDDQIRFEMIMTIEPEKDRSTVHGFLSKRSMDAHELISMWKYIKRTVPTRYLRCDVVPAHARVYKIFLDVVESNPSKTFNGHDCEELIIDLSKELRIATKERTP
jgi:hypothetical protein